MTQLNQNQLKQMAAQAAWDFIAPHISSKMILGIGTGSTVDLFIEIIAQHKDKFAATVTSSVRSTKLLEKFGIKVIDLNEVDPQDLPLAYYIDGADEINHNLEMIKGGGAALTQEKIVASQAKQFICIVDDSKLVDTLGDFALPIEVISMAINNVSNLVKQWGGSAQVTPNLLTDNGHPILRVSGLKIDKPLELEQILNNFPGIVTCGIFALHKAQVAIIASKNGIKTLQS